MIAIIGTVGVPACYGGFETLVDNLLDGDTEYTVYCSSKCYERKFATYKSSRLVYLPFNANGVSSIFYDAFSMIHALISKHRTFLVLGVSAGLMIPIMRILFRRRLVVNIDGLEWRREKWSSFAKWYLKLSERAAVKFSDDVIADNQAIADYVQNEYGVRAHVIAYGGDHVLNKKLTHSNHGYAFGLCRIEPENNVHLVLEAFSKSNKKLKFVGNWDASEYGRKLKQEYLKFEHIDLLDPIYDLARLFEYRDNCDFYVHGHSAGGTNPSLVEAMFFGKPIIAYDCVYNRATMRDEGMYFSEVDSLLGHLSNIESWPLEMGLSLSNIAKNMYTWSKIRHSYETLVLVE